ncbi:hypothetical protein MNV49_003002 [Pseudohyphozyma bogoriensis]|nr:hypothetical protein MNV49_003002 [Pseudohyphozyma bogoriensis]
MPFDYKVLDADQRDHFVQHGWVKIANALNPELSDKWMKDLWVRLGWDEHDPSTWEGEYCKMPRHREVPVQELCPKAWEAMIELVGGEDKIDPVRERYHGDQFIVNFGSEHWDTHEFLPTQAKGWHHDNDWYRQFLDSSGNALTIIHCFTDIPPRGGGTFLCEDGIKQICEYLLAHPEGLDPPLDVLYEDMGTKCHKFAQVEAKKGDVFLLHGLLPHANSANHLRYARVIANPHCNMVEPFNLNRADGDYTLCEQVILNALGRTSIPEYAPTRSREVYYPWTANFKRARVQEELQRMLADAEARGLGPDAVDSVYLKGEEAIKEHERRNGYDKEQGPGADKHTGDGSVMKTKNQSTGAGGVTVSY